MKSAFCLLVMVSLVLPWAMAAETKPLAIATERIHIVAGETATLELPPASTNFVRQSAQLSSETLPQGPYHIALGKDPETGTPFIAVPPTIPPGTYSVKLSVVDPAGEDRTATIQVIVEAIAPMPRTAGIPVLLLNGFQPGLLGCPVSVNSGTTFGNLQSFLEANGDFVFFLDNCTYGNLPIEGLGNELGTFIASLRYTDGSPVPQVDIVAHSMGGLIARSYLAGKQTTSGTFMPPNDPKVRKLVFIATPNFGSFQADCFLCGLGVQLPAMRLGSQFLWDLAKWNQGFDDLREVDTLAVIGNGGSYFTPPGADDGVVSLSSASTFFARGVSDERTRIVPYCHTTPPEVAVDCPTGTTPIANIDSANHLTSRIVRSFLAGTTEWKSIGWTPSQDPFLSRFGGVYFASKDANDNFMGSLFLGSTDRIWFDSDVPENRLQRGPDLIFFKEFVPSGTHTFHVLINNSEFTVSSPVVAGRTFPLLVKFPPLIQAVQPAAGAVNTLSAAPGSLISIFGAGLASEVRQAQSLPLPTQLADTMVLANAQLIDLLYVGDQQINAFLPPNLSGLVKLKVRNSLGEHTTNVLLAPAVPAIFTLDSSGNGPAAAIHAGSGQVVSENNPALAGEYISIFATGLGATFRSNNLDVAFITPQVELGNTIVPVSFAGRAPGFVGLDQINVQITEGVQSGDAVPLVIISGKYRSNVATLAVSP